MEIYLDNSATTKPYEEVIEAMGNAMREFYANPSAAYKLGMNAEKKISECRDIIGRTINASRDEIIFTSGGSEANNFLIRGFLKEGSHIITSKIEHPSVLKLCRELEENHIRVTYLDVNSKGEIDIKQLEESIDKDTVLVSIMHVNNEIGVVQDLETIGSIIKQKSQRVKFHVDTVQSYGKYKIDVEKFNIDMLSVSTHKFHGPRGVGFAYLKKGLNPKPLIIGGGQERSFRAGTENTAGIVGLTVAAEIMYKNLDKNYQHVMDIKKYFIKELSKIEDIKINSEESNKFSPYVLNVSFRGIRSEILLRVLDEKGIYVSVGSACSAKKSKQSHVLQSIGLSDKEILGSIRFSFCEYTTKEEIDYTMEVLKQNIILLRRMK
ncbi:cysteine desulfurase family protein [Hathewaya histolytica]|uniref:Cysteine desulfurase family protein n=1 Tax=Hathewaya histolytica TaxID=1498 RepID=A0A4U9QWG5_HATHI|nr:cysteine desulfurase family protein [Hathewaya histolytica]VTQ83005.1 cysteine desulfurase family protein [Hathewaya histolytica]